MYKVLWIDNDPNVVESTQLLAEDFDLELCHFPNWEDAERSFSGHIDDWVAVIFDANCEFKKGELESGDFLRDAVRRFYSICGEKQVSIAWYVLSAGTVENFNSIIQSISDRDRVEKIDECGKIVYLKVVEGDDGNKECKELFSNIRSKVGPTHVNSQIRFKYSKVFDYIDGNDLDMEVDGILVNALKPLHYPDSAPRFDPYKYYNQLRLVTEFIYRGLNKYGIIPDECIPKGKVNLGDCAHFLAGKDAKEAKVRTKNGIAILPKALSQELLNIYHITNSQSHTEELSKQDRLALKDAFAGADPRTILFSYTLQLCGIIQWMSKYVKDNPDRATNLNNVESIVTQ